MTRTVTIRSLVNTGNFRMDYDAGGRLLGKTPIFEPEWTEVRSSARRAQVAASDCGVEPDEYILWTDAAGSRYLDIGGPMVEARQARIDNLYAIKQAQALLKQAAKAIRENGPHGLVLMRQAAGELAAAPAIQ